jgi:hypothetical protein
MAPWHCDGHWLLVPAHLQPPPSVHLPRRHRQPQTLNAGPPASPDVAFHLAGRRSNASPARSRSPSPAPRLRGFGAGSVGGSTAAAWGGELERELGLLESETGDREALARALHMR